MSSRGPFVPRQRKRLEKGDPITLQGHNARGDRVIYSGVVTSVALDGQDHHQVVRATIRTEDGFVDVTLELPE